MNQKEGVWETKCCTDVYVALKKNTTQEMFLLNARGVIPRTP